MFVCASALNLSLFPITRFLALPQVTIHAYTDVVCRRLSDIVPKQVHHFLVDRMCTGLVPWMVNKVTVEDLEDWFAEDAKTQRKRKDTCRKLEQFKQSMNLLEGARSTIE